MSIRVRSYKGPGDFERIGHFLVKTYQPKRKLGNWLQPRWEYMYYHPDLDESALNRIGVWEDDGNIVGVAVYEMRLGEVYFQIHPDFAHLKSDMLKYAENHLPAELDDERRYVRAYINDFDIEFESIAKLQGYKKCEDTPEPESQFTITDPFPTISLPAEFQFKSLQDDNDLNKIHRVLHRGFNHPGDPPEEGIEGRRKMESAPNFRRALNIVVEAPEGSFASYCGMWYEASNKIAYVEPVATDPDYRRMGLGTAAVLEGIRRCGELGATVAFVGTARTFYTAMGFRKIFTRYPWIKHFDLGFPT
ncbi:hypothetical protein ES703_64036 [subsurface metagenome]